MIASGVIVVGTAGGGDGAAVIGGGAGPMSGGGADDEKTVFQSAKDAPIAATTMNVVTIGWLFIFSKKSGVCTVPARSVSGEEAEVQI